MKLTTSELERVTSISGLVELALRRAVNDPGVRADLEDLRGAAINEVQRSRRVERDGGR